MRITTSTQELVCAALVLRFQLHWATPMTAETADAIAYRGTMDQMLQQHMEQVEEA